MIANELRIGNFIKDEENYLHTIIGIEGNLGHIGRGSNWVASFATIRTDITMQEQKSLVLFSPIKLTKEWLLKFGFEKYDESYWVNPNYPSYEIGINLPIRLFLPKENELEVDDYNTSIDNNCVIAFVHQLQNLYYALTGKELELINP